MNPRDLGFGNRSDDRKTYFTIIGGKFSIPTDKDNPDAVSRINKEKKEVWELQFTVLEDVIIRNIIKDTTGKFGAQWIVTFEKNGNLLELKMGYASREALSLITRLPNIVIDRPISLQLYTYETTSLVVYQGGQKVPKYFQYDKNDPSLMHGMPDAEWIEDNGVEKLNFSKQCKFLHEYIESQFRQYFDNLPPIIPVETMPAPKPSQTTAGPVQSASTPVAAIKDHPFAMEYKFACDAGFKGSIQDYEKLRPAYMEVRDRFGFNGTIVDYQKSLEINTSATPPAQTTAAAPPATAKPTPPPPGPKLGNAPVATSGGEKPLPKGTTVHDPMQAGFDHVKKNGYEGSIEDFAAFCKVKGLEPNRVLYSASMGLFEDDLPF